MRGTKIILLFSLTVLFFCLSQLTWAHPHMFIKAKHGLITNPSGVTGLQVEWEFDQVFSQQIVMSFDTNKNGKFESEEIKAIREGAFSNLKNYHYFTYAETEQGKFPIENIRDFSARIGEHGFLYYTFTVPVHISADTHWREFRLLAYDDTYFVDIIFAENYFSVQEQESLEFQYTKLKNPERTYYFGTIVPEQIAVKVRKK